MNRLPVDTEAIRTLAQILQDTGLTEIEIAEKDSRIRVVRAPAQVAAMVPAPAPAAPAVTATLGGGGQVPIANADGTEDYAQHPGAVKSPMVGVAFLSPEPGAAPFVTAGQSVAAGQTLLLIEAMKTFNQIKAPRSGTITRIMAQSSVPVEYGQVLMVID
jgi:acetyl-CoA carboxylase biotin carboxyl carrier protein